MKTTTIGISTLLTGVGIWVSSNLGSLFWILLAVSMVDFIIGWVLMMAKQKEQLFTFKSIRTFAVLGVPVIIGNFAQGINHASLFSAMQIVFAILIFAQLSTVVPNIITAIKFVSAKLFGKKSPITQEIDHMGITELQKLVKAIDEAIAANSSVPSNMDTTSSQQTSTAMTAGNPQTGMKSGG